MAIAIQTYGQDHIDRIIAQHAPYGNGLGFDGSVRVIQLTGKIVF